MISNTEYVAIETRVTVCRDSKDDKFLECALNGRADLIISGDKDLCTLKSYQGIPILTSVEFLNQHMHEKP